MNHEFVIQGQPVALGLRRAGSGWVATFADGHELRVSHWAPGHLLFEDGTSLEYARGPEQVTVLGQQLTVKPAAEVAAAESEGATDGKVSAPMNGQVAKLLRQAGQTVQKGEVVLVLEAMKMENEVTAPQDGLLESVAVTVGQTVSAGEPLFAVTQNGEAPCP